MTATLAPGRYRTAAGSTAVIQSPLRHAIDFDWLEEGACIECTADIEGTCLVWSCEDHQGSAELIPDPEPEPEPEPTPEAP